MSRIRYPRRYERTHLSELFIASENNTNIVAYGAGSHNWPHVSLLEEIDSLKEISNGPSTKTEVYSIAVGVYNHGNDLYSAKLIKMKEGKISEWKHGVETSLGHAIAIAENLLSAYAVQAHEVPLRNSTMTVTVV